MYRSADTDKISLETKCHANHIATRTHFGQMIIMYRERCCNTPYVVRKAQKAINAVFSIKILLMVIVIMLLFKFAMLSKLKEN